MNPEEREPAILDDDAIEAQKINVATAAEIIAIAKSRLRRHHVVIASGTVPDENGKPAFAKELILDVEENLFLVGEFTTPFIHQATIVYNLVSDETSLNVVNGEDAAEIGFEAVIAILTKR
jgi:hydroxymethylpyrimidine/phosphomethylpyrimidine kinase